MNELTTVGIFIVQLSTEKTNMLFNASPWHPIYSPEEEATGMSEIISLANGTDMNAWRNDTNETTNKSLPAPPTLTSDTIATVVLYCLIFLCSIVGNALVILTLGRNKHMRTVTNAFLTNLAISDLLLSVFCMPFTLIGSLMRNFIFGGTMCRLIPYLQAVSVSVSVWTLVAISLERFFAICRPLRSRQWQTISHAHRVIASIWIVSLIFMLPIACLSQLLPTRTRGKFKCREVWPDLIWKQIFDLYLDVILLLIPLGIMTIMYSFIIRSLRIGLRTKANDPNQACLPSEDTQSSTNAKTTRLQDQEMESETQNALGTKFNNNQCRLLVRSSYSRKKVSKKRIICMLCVLVVEFFVCWTPLYVVNTWVLFDSRTVYANLGLRGISIIQLLAYTSSCCNPITYCFMHKKFRQSLKIMLKCNGAHKRRPSYYSDTCATTLSMSRNSGSRPSK